MSLAVADIRAATARDASACAAIVNGWIDRTAWMPRTATPDALREALAMGLPRRTAWTIGDPVRGYLSMDAEAAHIWGLHVALPGNGLGKALLDRAKAGRGSLSLNSHAANTRAHAFYAREGFVRVGKPWRGEDGIDEIRMEWRR